MSALLDARILRGDHCQCGACKQLFNSTAAFDKHRTGDFGKDRRCRTVAEMLQAGMAVSGSGWWVTSPRENAPIYPSTDSRIDSQGGVGTSMPPEG